MGTSAQTSLGLQGERGASYLFPRRTGALPRMDRGGGCFVFLAPHICVMCTLYVCSQWFELWRHHIKTAVARGQRLQVFYFEGMVGRGNETVLRSGALPHAVLSRRTSPSHLSPLFPPSFLSLLSCCAQAKLTRGRRAKRTPPGATHSGRAGRHFCKGCRRRRGSGCTATAGSGRD